MPVDPGKLKAAGFILLGAGMLWEGVQTSRSAEAAAGAPPPDDDGRLGSGRGRLGSSASGLARGDLSRGGHEDLGKGQIHYVDNIDERVNLIRKLVRASSVHGDLHERAVQVVTRVCGEGASKTWCTPEKDWEAEAVAVFNAVRSPGSPLALRYTRDMLFADTFKGVKRTLRTKGGDCDDGVILLASALTSIGFLVKLRVIQSEDAFANELDWDHIYLIVGLPRKGQVGEPERWIALDPSEDRPAGWEMPGAAEVARTGRPSGYVHRLRDFNI